MPFLTLLVALLLTIASGQALAVPKLAPDPLAEVMPGYATVWREHGVVVDDYGAQRLGASSVPAELFQAPDGQAIDSMIVIDALSLLQRGFRVVTLSAITGQGATTRVFHEDHRRLSRWGLPDPTPAARQQHMALKATLAALEPVSVAELQVPGKPGIVHLPGPVLNQTHDSPVPTNPFAGYLGVVSLIDKGRITRQWPIAWFDLADPRAAIGNLRPPMPGRIALAMNGEPVDAIRRTMDDRALEIRISAGDVTVIGSGVVGDARGAAPREERTEARGGIRTRQEADRTMADGWTPLMIAAGHGRLPLVRALLALGADPEKLPSGGPSPLELAVRQRHEPLALALLEHGARPDPTPSLKGVRPVLTVAASNGNLALVEALLKAGAKPDRAVGIGATALTVAAAAPPHPGQQAMLRLLLAHGADPHHLDTRYTGTLDLLQHSNPSLAARMRDTLSVPVAKIQACRGKTDDGSARHVPPLSESRPARPSTPTSRP